MPNVYPTKLYSFIVADAVRQDAGGKLTILGAFTGGKILVPPGTTFPISLPLGVAFIFRDGEGTFNSVAKIIDPNGNMMLANLSLGQTTKTSDQALQLVLNFGIFTAPATGDYRFEIALDSRVYSDSVTIGVSAAPATVT